jgi:L-cysteine S-thiosulfotransferase
MDAMKKMNMNMMMASALTLGLTLGLTTATTVYADPAAEQGKILAGFKKDYPDVKFDDMIHGAMVFSADAKSQYNAIMEMPPFLDAMDAGKKMWDTPFKNGKTYAECMPNGGKQIAGNYPQFDDKKGEVVTFEMTLNGCRTANGETALGYSDMKTMGVVTAYARSLSDGMKVNVKVEGDAAKKAYAEGKKTYFARAGQLNFSCANCHIGGAGNNLRSEILSPVVGQATHWPVFRGKDGGDISTTLQNRYVGCFKQVRHVSEKEGSKMLNNLEYYHASLSNGLPMQAPVYRK